MLKSNLQYISTKIYFYDSSKELMMFNTPQQLQMCRDQRNLIK